MILNRIRATTARIVSAVAVMAMSTAVKVMSNREKFFFDLNGFIIVRNALSIDEVNEMNSAIDAHIGNARARDISPLKNTVHGDVSYLTSD